MSSRLCAGPRASSRRSPSSPPATTRSRATSSRKGARHRIPNQERRIPPGTYTLRWHTSPRFRATLPHLYNEQVPRERYILIHAGNTAADTEGCLLPGKTFTKDSVGSSRAMLAELIEFFRSRGIENVSLVIEEDFR